jgi:hypothetical protein
VLESEQSLSGGGRRERLNHGGASLSGRSFFNFTLLSHESLCLRPLLLVEGRRARYLTLFSWRRHSISWAWYKPRSVLVPCPSDGGTTRGTTGGTRGHDIEASVHGNRGGEGVGRGDRCRQEAGDKRNHRAREGGRHRVRVAGRRTRRRRDVPARQRHDNGGDAAELLESFGDQLDAYKEQVAYLRSSLNQEREARRRAETIIAQLSPRPTPPWRTPPWRTPPWRNGYPSRRPRLPQIDPERREDRPSGARRSRVVT